MVDRKSGTEDAVVVPSDHGGSSLACIRSLGRAGYRVIGVAANDTAPPLESKYCDESYVVPAPGQDLDGYRDALLGLAECDDVLTIAPLYEPDIYVLSKNRSAFARAVATPWGDYPSVRKAQDRLELFELADAAGVRAPETELLSQWDRWDEPTVVKSRYALCVEDGTVSYPEGRVFEPGAEPDCEAVVREMGHEPIAQEYVPAAAEHGFFGLCDAGDCVAAFQHQRIRSYSYDGGASVYRESVDIPELASAGRRMLTALEWDGPGMVEFRRDKRDGAFKLMEVNPRFWGSLPLAVHSGVDFPRLYCRLAAGEFSGPPPDYDTGVGCHTLRGEVSHLHSVLRYDLDHAERPSAGRTLLDIAASIVRERNFDYLSLDDRAPFVRDFLNTVESVREDATG